MSKESLDELAEAVDKDCVREEEEIAAVTAGDGKKAADPGSEDTVTTKMIEALEKWSRKETWPRRVFRNSTPTRHRSHNGSNTKPDLCWAHRKFGDEAQKCQSWCKEWKKRAENAKG